MYPPSTSATTKHSYRPDIDGLRAVAVLVVVLFHAGLGFPGGYVGVDVFFVISGFLITSLIWKDLQLGRFTLAHFWERRARRILPALLLVSMATLIAGWFLLMAPDFASLGKSAAYQAVFGANVYYWLHANYFSAPAEQQPLLHTWSLAVEEQFYMVVPLLFMWLFRVPLLRRRAVAFAVLALGLVCGLALSTYAVAKHPIAAFYLLPFRAWELALGSLLALIPASRFEPRRICSETLAILGLGLILSPALLYQKETPFPGLAAIPPCVGTALIIWSNLPSPTLVGKMLSWRPVVFVGLISYSLYLWHWPLLAFSKYWALQPLPLGYRVALVVVALALAIASWRFVETPMRQRRLCSSRKSIFAFAGIGLTTLLLTGTFVTAQRGVPQRLPKRVALYSEALSERPNLYELNTKDILDGNLVPFGSETKGAPVRVLVWGDSHAKAALPAFDVLCRERGISGRAATHSSTTPVLGYYNDFSASAYGLGRESLRFNEAVFDYIRSNKIPDVVLIANWSSLPPQPRDANSVGLQRGLISTVRRLAGLGARPWILLQVPIQPFNVPKALARAAMFHEDLAPLCARPGDWNGLLGNGNGFLAQLSTVGARLIDPRPRFLDPQRTHYVVSANGIPLYYDEQHLTVQGADLILLPLLRETLP